MSKDTIAVMGNTVPNKQHLLFYKDLGAQVTRFQKRYKSVSHMDSISIMSCLLGVLIARVAPEVQPLARAVVNRNIDVATENVAQSLMSAVEPLAPKPEEANATPDIQP